MEFKGKLWPSDSDRQTRTMGLHVALGQPEGEPYRVDAGIASYTVTESEDQVAVRLERDFPLYKLAQYGRRLLGLAGGGDEV